MIPQQPGNETTQLGDENQLLFTSIPARDVTIKANGLCSGLTPYYLNYNISSITCVKHNSSVSTGTGLANMSLNRQV